MSDELNRLRADLKVIERYEGRMYALAAAKAEIGNKIDKLEAAADPWREAKQFASAYRDPKGSSYLQKLIAHYDHLAAEVARLTERVAELGAALRRIATVPDCGCVPCRGQCDSAENLRVNAEEIREIARSAVEGVKPITDMQPPFEGPIVGIEPVLDHARVLATACGIMGEQGWIMNDRVREELKCGAKPYPLKKGGE